MGVLFSKASILLTGILATFEVWLGGWDKMLIALITLIVIDYVTGLLKAGYHKRLNSEVGYKGIFKKIAILIAVVVATVVQHLIPDIPIRGIVISFYLANEGISICENLAKIIPLPEKLKQYFEQLREDGKHER